MENVLKLIGDLYGQIESLVEDNRQLREENSQLQKENLSK